MSDAHGLPPIPLGAALPDGRTVDDLRAEAGHDLSFPASWRSGGPTTEQLQTGALVRALAVAAAQELEAVIVPGTDTAVLELSSVVSWLEGWAIRVEAGRTPGQPTGRYTGPAAVGRTPAHIGRTIRIDVDLPHGGGFHGQGMLLSSQPSDASGALQDLLLDINGQHHTLRLPLTTTVQVLP